MPAFLREATLAWECIGAQVVRRGAGEEASMWACEQDSRTVSGLLETPREAGAGPLCCLCCCLPAPVFSLSRGGGGNHDLTSQKFTPLLQKPVW